MLGMRTWLSPSTLVLWQDGPLAFVRALEWSSGGWSLDRGARPAMRGAMGYCEPNGLERRWKPVMRLDRASAVLFCLLGLWLPVCPALALQFEQVPISTSDVIVGGRGPIVKGDLKRMEAALAAVPSALRVAAMALDSPGGNVEEGEALAQAIRTRGLTVVIPSNSKCVSACFLLLAASPRRLAAADALVGVHSASESGEETAAAVAVTTRMAQEAATLGIPPALIGKMVQTAPGRVEWLTRGDLNSMNVAVFDDDTPAMMRQISIAAASPAAPPLPALPAQPGPPPDYMAGSEGRRIWDTWLAGLRGPFRDGAAFAEAQIGVAQPAPCDGPNGFSRGDFTMGCEVARKRLAAADVKFRSKPDYAAGWNSAGQAVRADEPAEAEYQGAFFCGRQVGRLLLKVYAQADEPRRRAMFSFGPQPTSPEVPHGAFMLEGSMDLQGGGLSLRPVRWVTHPAGYNWLGLSGGSDDGGKTFSGRIVDNVGCTIFTLKRIDGTTVAR